MKQWKRLTGLAAKGKAGDARATERASGTPPGAQQASGASRARSSGAAEGMRGMAVTQTDSIEDEFQQGLQEVGEMRDKYERLLAAVADAQERAAECAEALHQLAAVVAEAFGGVEEGGAGDTLVAAAAVDGRLAELLYFYSLHLQQTLAEPAEALLGEMQHVVETKELYEQKRKAHAAAAVAAKARRREAAAMGAGGGARGEAEGAGGAEGRAQEFVLMKYRLQPRYTPIPLRLRFVTRRSDEALSLMIQYVANPYLQAPLMNVTFILSLAFSPASLRLNPEAQLDPWTKELRWHVPQINSNDPPQRLRAQIPVIPDDLVHGAAERTAEEKQAEEDRKAREMAAYRVRVEFECRGSSLSGVTVGEVMASGKPPFAVAGHSFSSSEYICS